MAVMAVNGDGEREVGPGSIVGENGRVELRTLESTVKFEVGERVSFSPQDFSELTAALYSSSQAPSIRPLRMPREKVDCCSTQALTHQRQVLHNERCTSGRLAASLFPPIAWRRYASWSPLL